MSVALSRSLAETDPAPGAGDTDGEFGIIQSCLASTERGRRFLAEFARRRRAEDSARILTAIDRLESNAMRQEIDRVRGRLEAARVGDRAAPRSELLPSLGPAAEPRPRVPEPTALERRFAALVRLDGREAGPGVKPFG